MTEHFEGDGASSQDQIRNANQSRYTDPDEVDTYLQRPYHALRMHLSIELLKRGTSRAFPEKKQAQMKVLELASATGCAAYKLVLAGYDVTASDIEARPLASARKKGLKCVQFDASQTFPFPNNVFQAILMGELIEHIFDTGKLLAECNRVLCPGGILVITTPNLARWQDRLKFLFGYAPRQVNPLHDYIKLHIRQFTYSLLKDILFQCGFETNEILSNYVVLDLASGKRLESRLLAKLFPTLGGSLIISAHKFRDV